MDKDDILLTILDFEEWKIFIKRLVILCFIFILFGIFWIFPASLMVAPFYSSTTNSVNEVKEYKSTVGLTTVNSVRDGLQEMLDFGLVTNFTGVNIWIDNRYYEQIGKIEMYRIAINSLENNLARNRGTGGANKHLVQARSDIYADYSIPFFTSYTTRLKQTIKNIDKYNKELIADKNLAMDKKRAVFIVNSDNLAMTLDKLKQQLQTNIMIKGNFFTNDDKFYRIKGNLIALYKFLNGIEYDYKNKMMDKTSYKENFIPLLNLTKKAISQNHLMILETFGHLSKLEKNTNIIAQKLGELRDKLQNG